MSWRRAIMEEGCQAYLENNKAIAVTAPPDYRTVCRVFEHPVGGASASRRWDERGTMQGVLVEFPDLRLG